MRVLLDTHSFLWWIMDDARLSLQARAVLRDGRNTLVVSAATGWEIAIKARLGKMMVPGDPAEFILQQIRHNYLSPLAISSPTHYASLHCRTFTVILLTGFWSPRGRLSSCQL